MKGKLSLLFLAATLTTGCGWTTPDAGHQSVLVEKPVLFGHGGVDRTPVTTGLTFVAITTDTIVLVSEGAEPYGARVVR